MNENILLQATTTGDVRSLEDLRGIVRASTETRTFVPEDGARWEEEYERYRKLSTS